MKSLIKRLIWIGLMIPAISMAGSSAGTFKITNGDYSTFETMMDIYQIGISSGQ